MNPDFAAYERHTALTKAHQTLAITSRWPDLVAVSDVSKAQSLVDAERVMREQMQKPNPAPVRVLPQEGGR
jgi:hypothetical protein